MKKLIFVVGAGKGLGLSVAKKFGNENFRVILIAWSEENLKSCAEELSGIEVQTQIADVTDFEKFSATFKNLTAIHGIPDVLFYNVGITTPDDKSKMNAQTLIDHYRADAAGAFNCIQLVDTEEFAKNHGAILITGGGLALNPFIDYLPLSMDKAALRAMILAMTPDLNSRGIYIGTVQVTGAIGSSDHFAPDKIAEKFWELYFERQTNEIIY